MINVEQFWQDGYTVVRNMIDPADVQRWRQRAVELGGLGPDLLSDPILSEIILHPSLIEAARDILGDQPVYFGNSSLNIGSDLIGGFHKDNSDRYAGDAPDWAIEHYPIVQFGIYGQPHGALPGGVDLRLGSHRHPDITTGRHVSPAVELGDVVFWNARTTHSSHSMILKGLGHRVEPNGYLWRLLVRIPKAAVAAVRRHHPEQRVFFGGMYGASHPLVDRHIAYLKTRTYAVECTRAAHWSEEARKIAVERGLKLIPPEDRLDGIGVTHDEFVQLPY